MDWSSPSWFMDCIPEDRYEFLQVPLMFWAGQSLLQAYLKKLIRFEQGVLRARWRSWLWPRGSLWRGLLLQGIVSGHFLRGHPERTIWLFNAVRFLCFPLSAKPTLNIRGDFGEENSEFSSAPSLSRQCTEFSDVVAQESWCSCFHDSFWKSRLCSGVSSEYSCTQCGSWPESHLLFFGCDILWLEGLDVTPT